MLVLHAHLPFVKHPDYDYFLEENWLFEAITETYLPILLNLKKLEAEARKNGKSIDMSKFITKNGTYVQDYNQSFIDTYSLLSAGHHIYKSEDNVYLVDKIPP